MTALFCGICLRPIPKKDVLARRFVHSRFTNADYCLDDAKHERIRAKRKAAA